MSDFFHWNPDPVCFHIFNIDFRYYSILWGIGLIAAYYVARYLYKRDNLKIDLLDKLFLYVFIGSIMGARLGHCLFYDWEYFSHHLLEMILPVQFTGNGIKFTGYAGLASHGGAIGILISLFLFSRKYKVPILNLLDTLGIIAPLSGAFIRVGNFVNSEIIGGPTTVPWAVIFESVDDIPRHPAQLYEAVAYFLIFGILLFIFRKKWAKLSSGIFFGLSIFLIFTFRFLVEYFKEIQVTFESGMQNSIGIDMGQLLSIPFILTGIFFMLRPLFRKSHSGSTK